jgi:hypothetical protein
VRKNRAARKQSCVREGSPGTLHQDAPHITIALTRAAGKALARTLGIAGTQPRPTGQVARRGEL